MNDIEDDTECDTCEDNPFGNDNENDSYLCSGCNGSGEGQYDGTICHYCHGSGVERDEPDVDIMDFDW